MGFFGPTGGMVSAVEARPLEVSAGMASEGDERYGLSEAPQAEEIAAPNLPYRPCRPRSYDPGIGLIGCGGVSAHHLNAYRSAGFRVVALCDRTRAKAEQRRREFYPDAVVHPDARALIDDPEVEVVDLTPHPADRVAIIEAAIVAGKHVLSQKPFVLDLADGERLAELAGAAGVRLAVNQNGRWAPHFAYARAAAAAGILGRLSSVDISLHFDHNWTSGTRFERMHHLILFDFAIHWLDILQALAGTTASRVFASVHRSRTQRVRPPLLAHAVIDYPDLQATLSINGDTRLGQSHRTVIVGDAATLTSEGLGLNQQRVRLHVQEGEAFPDLQGAWFVDGFRGAMAELLCAIEEDREPENAARDNLASLALCFAAIASADRGEPVAPGAVRTLPASVFAA